MNKYNSIFSYSSIIRTLSHCYFILICQHTNKTLKPYTNKAALNYLRNRAHFSTIYTKTENFREQIISVMINESFFNSRYCSYI